MLSNFSNNKKEFWKIIKHFTTKKDSVSSIPPLNTTTASGTHLLHVTDKEKADCLNSYFASISTFDDSHAVLPPFMELTDSVLDRIDISEEEIKDVIVNLDPIKLLDRTLLVIKLLNRLQEL